MNGISTSGRRADIGFTARVSADDLRRQLRISVGLVVVLAACIVSAALSVGPNRMSARRDVISVEHVVMLRAAPGPVGTKPI